MRSLVSHNGTVGHQMRKVQEFVYPWSHGALLVLHSDGVATHWKLEQYPGLFREDPAIIAAILYRDHARRTGRRRASSCAASARRRRHEHTVAAYPASTR